MKRFENAGVAQLVEHQPSKLRVAGSSLVFRSTFLAQELKNNSSCQCSSGVEHFHGKEGVTSSSLVEGLSDSVEDRSRGMWRRFFGVHAPWDGRREHRKQKRDGCHFYDGVVRFSMRRLARRAKWHVRERQRKL